MQTHRLMRALKRLAPLAVAMIAAVPAQGYKLIDGSLDKSDIYPGTRHTYKISIPEGYTGAGDAALYLGLDGILCDAPRVIDRLTAAGKMPVTIGVYLQPGTVSTSRGEVARWNRSNEFAATDSTFATFLERELLPQVARTLEQNGVKGKISSNPAHRMIFGLSSGGIAAFTAAWHRPDLFGKVMTGCATLVPMRGGHNLQAIVRKNEPKPLKIMIQDTYHDTWNPLFGSWYEANRMMASALQFAGYDMKEDWTEGVHSVARSAEIFPAVMEWMWAGSADKDGYARADETIEPGATANNFLSPVLIPGEGWKRADSTGHANLSVGAGMRRAYYPDNSLTAYRPADGGNFMWQALIGDDGKTEECAQRYYWLHTYDNRDVPVGGMAFDGAGNLWTVTGAGLQICDQNGRVRAILNLPRGINPAETLVAITSTTYQGEAAATVTLLDSRMHPLYTRTLRAAVPEEGVRPKSQGAA